MEDRRKRGVLGRGLSALLGDEPEAFASGGAGGDGAVDPRATTMVPVEFLQSGRFQPRTQFDQDALNDLADSIREKGIIQPILVRVLPEDPERYEIIAGERRWRAAQLAQVHSVPVLVRDFSDRDAAEVALVENLQRRDLSPLEEAEGYRRLQEEFQHTQDDLSKAVGKSRSHVANMIRLLALPEPVKSLMRNGSLTAGHARALLNADDPAALADQVVKKGLNVRQTEKLATEKGGVKSRKEKSSPSDSGPSGRAGRAGAMAKDTDTLALERDLARILGLKVSIEFEGRGGRVVIHYATLEQLDDILYRLNNPTDNAADARRSDHDGDDIADQAFAAMFAAKPMAAAGAEALLGDGLFAEPDDEGDPDTAANGSEAEADVGEEMLALTVEALMDDYRRETQGQDVSLADTPDLEEADEVVEEDDILDDADLDLMEDLAGELADGDNDSVALKPH